MSFTHMEVVAWLRDTNDGHAIIDREVEMKCQSCPNRPGVLLVYGVDGPFRPAWVEVYCERGVEVFSQQRLTVSQQNERKAEWLMERELPWKAKDLFYPDKLRRVVSIAPRTADDELRSRETLTCLRALKGQ
jgi:hypothetical protein